MKTEYLISAPNMIPHLESFGMARGSVTTFRFMNSTEQKNLKPRLQTDKHKKSANPN